MKVIQLPVGQLKANCYLLIDESTNNCVIIDPGDDADFIIRRISDEEVVPKKLVVTHGHFDHLLATTELKLAYNIPFLMHKKDEFLLNRVQSSAKHFLGVDVDPPAKVDKYISEGDEIKINNYKLKIIETPGHTPGSVTLISQVEKIAFVGDLIFEGGYVGRTDFKYSSSEDLNESIRKLKMVLVKYKIYPGHGDCFMIS